MGIVNNYKWRIFQSAFKQGANLVIFLMSAKVLGHYDFGLYNYSLAIVLFMGTMADFGISLSSKRFIAEFYHLDKNKMLLVLWNSFLAIFSVSSLIFIVILIFGDFFVGSSLQNILILAPLIFLVPLSALYDGLFMGQSKFREMALSSFFSAIISIPLAYILLKNIGLTGALISQVCFYLFAVISSAIFYGKFKVKFNGEILKKIIKYSVLIGIANVGYFLYARIGVFMLGSFGYFEEIGYFELANKIYTLAVIPFALMGNVLSPAIISMKLSAPLEVLRVRFKNVLKYTLISSLVVSFSVFLIIPTAISFVLPSYFGSEFMITLGIFLTFMPLAIVDTLVSIGFIVPTGKVKTSSVIVVLGVLLNIVLNYFFIPLWGYVGVVTSTAIVYNLAAVLKIVFFYRQSFSNPSVIDVERV